MQTTAADCLQQAQASHLVAGRVLREPRRRKGRGLLGLDVPSAASLLGEVCLASLHACSQSQSWLCQRVQAHKRASMSC